MKPFYVTTPIYYVNDKPHIGHAYSTVAADVLRRYQALRGRPTRFLTGTDEHGQKIERRAQEMGIDAKSFVDRMAPPFKAAFDELGCSYDDFIRTTEPRHEARVQALWKRIEARGDIYLGEYEDWYCVGCESFKTEKELLPGNLCPIHKTPVERVKEESYFFRLSKYAEPLLAFYEANPTFVQPDGRFNEVKSFVREGLRDLSISRTSFRWGIPVPGNDAHVMFVWFDALTNYASALGGPADAGEAPLFDRFWPPSGDTVHIVGKDILRFHAIYWPAFLLSAGFAPPSQVWAHGWLTVDGEKMSKSLGNFIPPGPLVREFGADVLRFYLMRDIGFGQDGDFSHKSLLARYRGDLGNGLGNLLHRILQSAVKKDLGGKVPDVSKAELTGEERALIEVAARVGKSVAEQLDRIAPHKALDAAWELVIAANKYVDQTAPWALSKKGDIARLEVVAYTVLEALRQLSVMLHPVLPERMNALRSQLGLGPVAPEEGRDQWPSAWGELAAGTVTSPGDPLFPRIDEKKEAEIFARLGLTNETTTKMNEKTMSEGKDEPKAEKSYLEFDDFTKVELRLGLVLTADAVDKSDKLVKLSIDLGEEKPRQVLAGIRQHYPPETLVGKRVVIVANLKPRKMMGLESHGMVLAVSDAGGLGVLTVEKPIAPGSRVS
jgi:methionyl-tRNA synthetase